MPTVPGVCFQSAMTSATAGGGGSFHRTPAVDAAMREAYPRVERFGSELWLHLPLS
jgi:hypothetical protein